MLYFNSVLCSYLKKKTFPYTHLIISFYLNTLVCLLCFSVCAWLATHSVPSVMISGYGTTLKSRKCLKDWSCGAKPNSLTRWSEAYSSWVVKLVNKMKLWQHQSQSKQFYIVKDYAAYVASKSNVDEFIHSNCFFFLPQKVGGYYKLQGRDFHLHFTCT